jgi:outer membrane protein
MTRLSRIAIIFLASLPFLAPAGIQAQEQQQETPQEGQTAEPQSAMPAETAEMRGPVLDLTLDDVVERALKNNAGLTVQRYDPLSSAQDVRSAEGAFDPNLLGQVRRNSTDSPATTAFSPNINTKTWIWNFGANQLIKTGAVWTLAFNNQRLDTTSPFSSFNPSYSSNLTLGITQPLLQNFKTDFQRTNLRVSKNNREVSDIAFRETVINLVANVKKLYYDVVFSIDNLAAQRKSLALAKKLLSENEIKVKVGTLAPLDVVQAQSEVAGREGDVIVAENAQANAEDLLKAAIFPKNDPEMWALRINPVSRPTAERREINVVGATQNALDHRTDITVARKNIESLGLSLNLAKSEVLPRLDLVGSYGATGQGGTQLVRDPEAGFGGPVIDTIPGGYGDAVSSVFNRDYPGWMVGVNMSFPLFNRQARATKAKAEIAIEQAQASLTRLELQIATEVRNAGRSVESDLQLVDATHAARILQERRLDAEEKKFAAGMSTNFFVTQAQRDLAVAEVNELQAVLNYRKSLIEFDRVQDAGPSSAGAVLVTALAGQGRSGQTTQQ